MTDLLIDAAGGLRVINEVEQLAAFEYASCQTSHGVLEVLRGVRPGMREREAVRLLDWNGMPLSCHAMLTAGPRATFGLPSPGDRRIELGDRFTTAFGVWGALTCRAGFVVDDAAGLPAGIGDYVDRLVGPYFAAVAEWYGAMRIGQTGGALHEIVDRHLGDPFFGIFLNPGHQLSLDEWVNSPIARGSTTELRSGMVFQVDIIPATGTPYFTTNIEDGIALADASLRASFAASYPDAWARIEGAPPVHGRRARHRAPSGRPAVQQHPGLVAAVHPEPRPGDDDRLTRHAFRRGSGGREGLGALRRRGRDQVRHDGRLVTGCPDADGRESGVKVGREPRQDGAHRRDPDTIVEGADRPPVPDIDPDVDPAAPDDEVAELGIRP